MKKVTSGDTIEIHQITTAAGNILQLFYNSENDLVVVDLIASNDLGGTELLRQTLHENKLLAHCVDKGQPRPTYLSKEVI